MIAYLISPIVAMLTLALISIRLFGPRPRWRRLASQPGMIAACARRTSAVESVSISGVVLAAGIDAGRWMLESSFFLPMFLGMAVVTSWMTLLFGRRWRAERSWVDRFGELSGATGSSLATHDLYGGHPGKRSTVHTIASALHTVCRLAGPRHR